MKFILKPSCYLVVKPQVDDLAVAKFLKDNEFTGEVFQDINTPSGELPTVIGGRTCYQSFSTGRKHEAYIKNIIESGHGSVLEHSVYGMLITGVSRSLTHELIRHRQFSPSELSQRFVECIGNFVVPAALVPYFGSPTYGDVSSYNNYAFQYIDHCEDTLRVYKYWLSVYADTLGYSGREAKEAARSKLTNDVETRILLTGDLRCWRVFFELRCSEGADKEIRRLANMCYEKLLVECPNIFADYVKFDLPDGTFTLTTRNRKV